MELKNILSRIIVLTFGVILITACNGSQPSETIRFTPPKADVRMGELLTLESVSYQVDDVYTREELEIEDELLGPSAMELQDQSMHFCQVEFTLVNHTDKLLSIEIDSIQFVGSDGQEYEPLGKLSDNSLGPKATRDFTLTFVVKRGMEVGAVVVVTDLSSNISGVIALRR